MKNNIINNEIVNPIINIFSSKVLSAFFSLIITYLISTTYGPEKYGLFSLILSLMCLMAEISDLGLSKSAIKIISSTKDNTIKYDIVNTVLKYKIIISFFFILFGPIVSLIIIKAYINDISLIYAYILIPIGAISVLLFNYINSLYQSFFLFRELSRMTYINAFIKILIILFAICVNLYYLNIIILYVVLNFLLAYIFFNKLGIKYKKSTNINSIKSLIKNTYKWVFVSNICIILFLRIDTLMIAYYKNSAELGYYSLAITLISSIIIITNSVDTILFPTINNNYNIIKTIKKKSYKIIVFTFSLIILGILLAKYTLVPIFGDEYYPTVAIFQILCIGYSMKIFSTILYPIFYSINKIKILAMIDMFKLILNFIGNIILIPAYGAIGASITTSATIIFGIILMVLYIYIKKVEI